MFTSMKWLLFLFLALAPAPAWAIKVYGAVVLDEAKKVSEGRYESGRDWDKTVTYFRTVYGKEKGIVWQRLETTPKVSGYHLANTLADRTWDGINLYHAEGKVIIVVLKHEPAKK